MSATVLSDISQGGEPTVSYGEEAVHVAVISAKDRVVAVFAHRTSEGLLTPLCRYVARNADIKLWSEDSMRVRELIRSGNRQTAVNLYFEKVGDRWDPEFIHREAVQLPAKVSTE